MSINLSITTTDLDNHQDLFEKLNVLIEETPGVEKISIVETCDKSDVTLELKDGRTIELNSVYDNDTEVFRCDVYGLLPFKTGQNSVFNWHPFNEMGGLDIRKFRQDYIDYVIKTY